MNKKELPKLTSINLSRPLDLARRLNIPLQVLSDITEHPERHYHSWEGITGNGKRRKFYQAEHDLEAVHQKINDEIFDRFDFPPQFQGGIKGRSLKSNALLHAGKENIDKLDIKSFFPSVSSGEVYATLSRLGCKPNAARMLTRLITADGHLPQGFKTSPKMAELTLLPVSKRLSGLTNGIGVSHSFWIDDLTLSGAYGLRRLRAGVKKIFRQAGFKTHKYDTSPVWKSARQVVAGVVVNDKPAVRKEARESVEKAVFLAEKNGLRWYKRNKEPSMGLRKLARSISGKIANMAAINDVKYQPLQERWEKVLQDAGMSERKSGEAKESIPSTR